MIKIEFDLKCQRALSVGTVEHANSIFTEGLNSRPINAKSCFKQSDGDALVLELWGNIEYPFTSITPRSTLIGVVITLRVLSMSEIELFDHLTACRQITDVKLNFWRYISILRII